MTVLNLNHNFSCQPHPRLVMCGCHKGGLKAIQGMLEAGYRFNWFVCLTPEQAKKYQVCGYYDYRQLADSNGIEVYIPRSYALTSEEDQSFFRTKKFDLLIQGGWQRLFPQEVLKTLNIGALGLHGSGDLLPKGRGRSPMNWSLIENRKRFLMHLLTMKSGVDDGDVIAIKNFDITSFDDIETLYFKYAIVYRQLLLENLPSILSNNFSTVPQLGKPTYYAKRTPEDGHIDWEIMEIWQIYNLVRATTRPYPGAFAEVEGSLIRIWRCRPFDFRIIYTSAKYGEIVERFENRILINCRGGLLLIDEYESIT